MFISCWVENQSVTHLNDGLLLSNTKEQTTDTCNQWMNFQCIMLSEGNQAWKSTHCDSVSQALLVKSVEMEIRRMLSRGRRGAARDAKMLLEWQKYSASWLWWWVHALYSFVKLIGPGLGYSSVVEHFPSLYNPSTANNNEINKSLMDQISQKGE
jgi:hypothetical protein